MVQSAVWLCDCSLLKYSVGKEERKKNGMNYGPMKRSCIYTMGVGKENVYNVECEFRCGRYAVQW